MIGLVVGFVGVGDHRRRARASPSAATAGLIAVGEVLLVAVCYAIAPFIVARQLDGVPALGTVTLSLVAVGLFYLPIAFLTQHEVPTAQSTVSLVALAVLCTAVAFIVFFALIDRVGPVRAPLFTYVNPVVAIVLGIIVLGEEITLGLLIGFPLVILGCWLAATGGTVRTREPPATCRRSRPAEPRQRSTSTSTTHDTMIAATIARMHPAAANDQARRGARRITATALDRGTPAIGSEAEGRLDELRARRPGRGRRRSPASPAPGTTPAHERSRPAAGCRTRTA